jgi:hypothetical protein
MRRPPKRKRRPTLERLESRRPLAGDVPDLDGPVTVEPDAAGEPPVEVQSGLPLPSPTAPRGGEAAGPLAEKTIRALTRYRVTIYGVALPAKLATGGKETKGTAVVGGGVVWLLDTSGVRGLTGWAERLVEKPVAVYGTAELTRDAKGTVKRKIKVNWLEPLERPAISRPFPNGVPKPKSGGPR